ncbi:MAG: hypothetical protein IPK25_09355 [Saprospiraceae bacterium]|nr:hypothetical protein [Saprospiraceae bacterium]
MDVITNKKKITRSGHPISTGFNLVPYVTSDGSTEYIGILGGFTSDGLSV